MNLEVLSEHLKNTILISNQCIFEGYVYTIESYHILK